MKKYLFLFLIALFTTSATAQDTMLTKEETINYLNKKLQESDGRVMIFPTGKQHRYSNLSIKSRGSDLELNYTDSLVDGVRAPCPVSQVFNPRDILRISVAENVTKESPLRFLRVEFGKKLGRIDSLCLGKRELKDVDKVIVPLFDTLTGNRQRFEKAFLHLRDLAKAEDDPFGN